MAEIVCMPSVASIVTRTKPEAPALPALGRQLPATPSRIFVRRAIKATAMHFGIAVSELISDRKTQPLSRRRQVAMYVAREMTGRSLEFIGEKIGERHHTTVLHGVRVIRGRLDAGDAEMVAAVEAIMARLRVTAGAPWMAVPPSDREALI
jgi:chromosomal replication initiator protein